MSALHLRTLGVSLLFAMASFLVSTPKAFAGAVSVNGNCIVGTCASPDVLPSPGLSNGTFSTTYTFADGDKYSITGNWHNTNNFEYCGHGQCDFESYMSSFVKVTYLGSAPTAGTDALTIDFGQGFNTVTSRWWGSMNFMRTKSYVTNDPRGGNQFMYFGPGTGVSLDCTTSLGGCYPNPPSGADSPLYRDVTYNITFGAGTPVKSRQPWISGEVVVPEPGSLVLLGSGALGLLGVMRRRLLV